MTREEQMLNGFAEMMKGFWNNQDLEVPNLESPCKQEPCDDTVSRQAAKLKVARVIWEDGDSCYDFIDKCVDSLDDVPPAQPEIIRCKDCKHYKAYEYTGKLACHYVIGGTVVRNLNDFCSRAERKTDEQT